MAAEPDFGAPPTRRTRRLALGVIALSTLGTGARLYATSWGLPILYHVDEKAFVLWEAVATEWRGLRGEGYRPATNTYGPALFQLAIAARWQTAEGGTEAARSVARDTPRPDLFSARVLHHGDLGPGSWSAWLVYLRRGSAILGGFAILLLAAAAWSLRGPPAGAFAAVLAALAVGLQQIGHFYTAEALAIPAAALSIAGQASLARGGRWGAAIATGLGLGLCALTKLPAGLVGLGVPAALVLGARARGLTGARALLGPGLFFSPYAWLALGAMVAPVALSAPWMLSEPFSGAASGSRSGLHMLRVQMSEHEFGFYDFRFPYNGHGPLDVLTRATRYAIGTGPLVAAGALVALATKHRSLRAIALLGALWTLPTLALVSTFGVRTVRYVLPAAPGLLVMAAALLATLFDWTRPPVVSRIAPQASKARPAWQRSAAALALVALLVPFSLRGIAYAQVFSEDDARSRAASYVLERAAPGDIVVMDPEASYAAPLGRNRENEGYLDGPRPRLRERLLWARRPANEVAEVHAEHLLRGARFVVIGEWYLRRAEHPEAPLRAPGQSSFYARLRAGELGFHLAERFDATPRLPGGLLSFDESWAEPMSVCFDHPSIEVYERDSE